jgi:hypothetical protein
MLLNLKYPKILSEIPNKTAPKTTPQYDLSLTFLYLRTDVIIIEVRMIPYNDINILLGSFYIKATPFKMLKATTPATPKITFLFSEDVIVL